MIGEREFVRFAKNEEPGRSSTESALMLIAHGVWLVLAELRSWRREWQESQK